MKTWSSDHGRVLLQPAEGGADGERHALEELKTIINESEGHPLAWWTLDTADYDDLDPDRSALVIA